MHKRNFSLTTGSCLNDDNYSLIAFDVRADEGSGDIAVLLPEPEELEELIGTSRWMVRRGAAELPEGIEIVGPDGQEVSAAALGNANGGAGCASAACGDTKLEW